jgi:hypothetical protein
MLFRCCGNLNDYAAARANAANDLDRLGFVSRKRTSQNQAFSGKSAKKSLTAI